MTLWTSDKYIAGIEKLTLSQSPTLNHGGSALQKQKSKYHRINMLTLKQIFKTFSLKNIVIETFSLRKVVVKTFSLRKFNTYINTTSHKFHKDLNPTKITC